MREHSQQEIATPKDCKRIEKEKRQRPEITKRLTYIATLVALSLLCKILGNVLMVGGFKVSLVYIPWLLSGIILGPWGGMAVGFATDALGTFLVPTGGSIIPLIVIGNTLFPFLAGLCYRYLPLKNSYLRLGIGVTAGLLVCTLGLNTLGLSLLYGIPYWAYLVTARLPQIAVVFANGMVAATLIPIVKKIKPAVR